VSTRADNPWLVRWRREAAPRATVFCLANVGAGAASFRSWSDSVPEGVDLAAVRLPGRENRLAETPYDKPPRARAGPVAALAPSLTVPFVLFGHCSGALAAFEFARELRREGLPLRPA
jgi:medium-chain acyl-[acyl-carrier-protein] hydrolase